MLDKKNQVVWWSWQLLTFDAIPGLTVMGIIADRSWLLVTATGRRSGCRQALSKGAHVPLSLAGCNSSVTLFPYNAPWQIYVTCILFGEISHIFQLLEYEYENELVWNKLAHLLAEQHNSVLRLESTIKCSIDGIQHTPDIVRIYVGTGDHIREWADACFCNHLPVEKPDMALPMANPRFKSSW